MKILEGAVDDPHLGNPLERMHRLGTGWFGVIFEFEGVLVESAHEDHIKAWKEVCAREGKPNPPHWQLQRVEGMKNEQVGHCASYSSTGMLYSSCHETALVKQYAFAYVHGFYGSSRVGCLRSALPGSQSRGGEAPGR